MSLESVLEGAAESLLEDERLRSNLTDAQAQVLINWALERLERAAAQGEERVPEEVARLRPVMRAVNDLFAAPPATCSAALHSLAPLMAEGLYGEAELTGLLRAIGPWEIAPDSSPS